MAKEKSKKKGKGQTESDNKPVPTEIKMAYSEDVIKGKLDAIEKKFSDRARNIILIGFLVFFTFGAYQILEINKTSSQIYSEYGKALQLAQDIRDRFVDVNNEVEENTNELLNKIQTPIAEVDKLSAKLKTLESENQELEKNYSTIISIPTPTSIPSSLLFIWKYCQTTYYVSSDDYIKLHYAPWSGLSPSEVDDNSNKITITLYIDGVEKEGFRLPPITSAGIPCGYAQSGLYWVIYETQLPPFTKGNHKIEVKYYMNDWVTDGIPYGNEGQVTWYKPSYARSEKFTIIST